MIKNMLNPESSRFLLSLGYFWNFLFRSNQPYLIIRVVLRSSAAEVFLIIHLKLYRAFFRYFTHRPFADGRNGQGGIHARVSRDSRAVAHIHILIAEHTVVFINYPF